MEKLISDTIQWQVSRNFYGEGGATLEGQTNKFFEEFGEYCKNKSKKKPTVDDIGDMMVVCIALLCLRYGFKKVDIDHLTMSRKRFDFNPSYFWFTPTPNYYVGFHSLKTLAEENGYSPTECLQHAYNEIKDRQGKWIDGSFVKESDLKDM